MQGFADYILSEKDYLRKIEIVYFFKRKTGIFFNKSVIFKTDLAKLFIEKAKLDVDKNLITTACLLYACKKDDAFQGLERIKIYAKESADYLNTLGFSDKFCKICEGHNRYTVQKKRYPESDILEIVDQFGAMLLHREERPAYEIDDALLLLENRNLKSAKNKYLKDFKEFLEIKQEAFV